MAELLGWDIGGVQVKAAARSDRPARPPATVAIPYEIWRQPGRLPQVLRQAAETLAVPQPEAMAVTMTAELSDVFRSRRQGVVQILQAVEQAFPEVPTYLLDLRGQWATLAAALARPLDFAAANWLAAALYVAGRAPDCVLVDVGSTTTDLIPIAGGRVAARGRSDTERLAAGELVYTGVLRSNPNTLTAWAPVGGALVRVAAEHFCLMADVYLLLGDLAPAEYVTPTADGRAAGAAEAANRLAHLVCADDETLGRPELWLLARYLAEKQLARIVEALAQVLSAQNGRRLPVLAAGAGRFLAGRAAERLGLELVGLPGDPGPLAVLPCVAAVELLAGYLQSGGARP